MVHDIVTLRGDAYLTIILRITRVEYEMRESVSETIVFIKTMKKCC